MNLSVSTYRRILRGIVEIRIANIITTAERGNPYEGSFPNATQRAVGAPAIISQSHHNVYATNAWSKPSEII